MEITAHTAEQLRIREDEFERIKQILGRTPNFTELCAFSGMWSEHCSYKNSIKWLKTLPREGKKMLVKAGEENAGLMDIGDGYGVVFKIESHNHPSAIEPFQGAATGVGGINRDIFTMGARPIASLNSLRFGNLQDPKTRHLLVGVVHGIGHYGNCFGVPTVGGEIYFENCYHTNPLVNAMSVGIVKNGETVSATAEGVGNPVFFVGSATGKDGIGGASFASAEITEDSAEDLPAVQVGDPFQEKKLLEACLEVIQTGAVVGMQDMGAAGIICSTSEMSAKGKCGMNIYLEKVPTRQKNMKPWELLLSESQERMLLVVEKGREDEVLKVFEKWDLPCENIGEVTRDGILNFFMHGQLEASIPAWDLVLGGGAPQYEREYRRPAYLDQVAAFKMDSIPEPDTLKSIAKKLCSNPNIASKRWVYEQYDSMVGAGTASSNSPSDAAIVLAKPTSKALALTTDCNSRYVFSDPYKGTMIAVAEAARNIVCSGGTPLGVTNCLNFGNPYDPEVYYQFVEAIKGMGEACHKFDTPVTGGNVSFYNQSPEGAVYPTPTIGMVGLLEDISEKMTLNFKNPGDLIFLVGKEKNCIHSSEYLHKICGVEFSPAPAFNLDEEFEVQSLIRSLIGEKLVNAVHDISEGGLAIALLECGFYRNLGFRVSVKNSAIRKDSRWFGEAQSRVLVTVLPERKAEFLGAVKDSGVEITELGVVQQDEVVVDNENWGPISNWKYVYDNAIGDLCNSEPEGGGSEAPRFKPLKPDSRIVVTGAAGFIGSCLAGYLNEQGYHNLILVDEFSRKDKIPNYENKHYAEKVERSVFFDWLNEQPAPVDFIFHLGARTDTTEFDYSVHQKLNVEYSERVWNYCTLHQVPLVYASSAATYGGGELGYNDSHQIIESLHPLNPYGKSKNEFDKWVLKQEKHPPFWAGLKFFNVYGPNEYHKGRMASVIFHSFNQIKQNGFVKLFKSHKEAFLDGEQLRDFIYVKDILKVCCWLMNHPQTPSAIYNLGTGKSRTFIDLVTKTFEAIDTPTDIRFIDMPADLRDTYQYFTEANMEKLKHAGYSEKFYSLEEGVEDYVRNYLSQHKYY